MIYTNTVWKKGSRKRWQIGYICTSVSGKETEEKYAYLPKKSFVSHLILCAGQVTLNNSSAANENLTDITMLA